MKRLTLPLKEEDIAGLKAGESVYLTGYIYTARDAAHKRLYNAIKENKSIPIDLSKSVIYYAGPCPNKPGEVIGSCGPTTSMRMDKYTPLLMENGLRVIIGKGERGDIVLDAIKKYKGVYFAAVGGSGALIKNCIKSSEVIAYDDLLSEAIRKMYVEDLPVITAIDSNGKNLYKTEREKYKR